MAPSTAANWRPKQLRTVKTAEDRVTFIKMYGDSVSKCLTPEEIQDLPDEVFLPTEVTLVDSDALEWTVGSVTIRISESSADQWVFRVDSDGIYLGAMKVTSTRCHLERIEETGSWLIAKVKSNPTMMLSDPVNIEIGVTTMEVGRRIINDLFSSNAPVVEEKKFGSIPEVRGSFNEMLPDGRIVPGVLTAPRPSEHRRENRRVDKRVKKVQKDALEWHRSGDRYW